MVSDLHGLWILGVSVVALLVGPAIHRVARREPVTMAALDNFVLVVIVGLVTLEIFPAALTLAGPLALVALLLGALGPALADGPLHRASHGTHSAALTLAIVGVALHSITDGVALASAHAAGGETHALEAAVIAHQLPVSVAVWWLLSPVGPARAVAAMIGLGLATAAGFFLADGLLAALDTAWLGALQALFAGFLLHVLAHRSGPVDPHAPRARMAASFGGLVGVTLLVFLAIDDHGHADEPLPHMLGALASLARASAPVLLAALALAPALPPLAALLIPLGLAPGAALAFILTGPAAAASRSLPVRLALVAATLVAAVLLDVLLATTAAATVATADAAALALALLLLASLVRQTPQQFLRRLWSPPGARAGVSATAHPHHHSHSHSHSHGP